MEEIIKATKLFVGLDVQDTKLRRTMMQLLAGWGIIPVCGEQIDKKCSLIFADTWDRAAFWEVESEAEWENEPLVFGIGFEISQRQIEPVVNAQTTDDFRMMIYYWLGNFWKLEFIYMKHDIE